MTDLAALLAEAAETTGLGFWNEERIYSTASGLIVNAEFDYQRFAEALAATPAGQRLAAMVETGMAVERLESQRQGLTGRWDVWHSGDVVIAAIYDAAGRPVSHGEGPTLPAAITAALGEQPMGLIEHTMTTEPR
jgi:hypothetical protein